jgi:hypothetical protein
MLKNLLLLMSGMALAATTSAQITITAADMPVVNDTLRSSAANPLTAIDITTTGTNTTWNYSTMVPVSQTVDAYKTAAQVNIAYAAPYLPALMAIKYLIHWVL